MPINMKYSIGDKVYFIDDDKMIKEIVIESITIRKIHKGICCLYNEDDYGFLEEKDLYKTKKQAQAKLKGGKKHGRKSICRN